MEIPLTGPTEKLDKISYAYTNFRNKYPMKIQTIYKYVCIAEEK